MHLTDILILAVTHGMEKRSGVVLPLAVGATIPGVVGKAVERSRSTEHRMEDAIDKPFKTAAMPLQLALPMALLGQKIGPAMSGAGRAIGNQAARAGMEMLGRGQDPESAGGLKGSFQSLGAAPLSGVAQGVSGGIGETIKRMFVGREFGEKKDPLHLGASSAIGAFGKEMGTTGANLLRDIANKAMEAVGQAGDASARQAILGELKRIDPVLADADDKILMESYHTMTRFAPVLSTDKNAVRSFLRQAVMSGTGPDFMSIKHLADSERAVTGGKDAR